MIEFSYEDTAECSAVPTAVIQNFMRRLQKINHYLEKHARLSAKRILSASPEMQSSASARRQLANIASKAKYSWLWDIANHMDIFLSVSLYFVVTALNLLPAYINRILVDEYITPKNAVLTGFLAVIASMVGVYILRQSIAVFRNIIQINVGNKVIIKLRSMVFEKIQQLSLSNISKRTAGELMQRVTRDTNILTNYVFSDLPSTVAVVHLFATTRLAW